MNEKELRKLILEKQKEVEATQLEYDRVHYSKQVEIFKETLGDSIDVLNLIKTEELTTEDCRLLASIMAKKIRPIYRNFAETITQNKERRKRKNEVRNEHRQNNTSDGVINTEPEKARPYASENTADDIRAAEARQY